MTFYTPKSEEQLVKEGLLSKGEYDFEVTESVEGLSKKQNTMLVLDVTVFGPDGERKYVKDYIAFGSNFGERKFRHAADACGLTAQYEAGTLRGPDFKGACGRALVDIDENPGYSPKNVIKDYVKRKDEDEDEAAVAAPAKAPADLDDEIPF